MTKKKKIIHFANEYPCSHCGFVETACGQDFIFEEDENYGWTDDEDKVTCKLCKKELIPLRRNISQKGWR